MQDLTPSPTWLPRQVALPAVHRGVRTPCSGTALFHYVVQPRICRFDLPAVYREARRILKPTGAMVAWTYTVRCPGPAVLAGLWLWVPVAHSSRGTAGIACYPATMK